MTELLLEKIIRELPHSKTKAHRLRGGLGLRYSEGMGLAVLAVLSCSRIDKLPSETEMKTVAAAVRAVFAPHVIFADLHIDIVQADGSSTRCSASIGRAGMRRLSGWNLHSRRCCNCSRANTGDGRSCGRPF